MRTDLNKKEHIQPVGLNETTSGERLEETNRIETLTLRLEMPVF